MGLNLPNWITLFRIILIPVFMTVLLGALPGGATWAAIVFVIAAASDSLDGYFARRRRQLTVLGAFLDPLADKLLVTSALLALIELGRLSAWVAMVIIAREFAVSGLRMVAAAENVIIPASRWGKVKTTSQMVAILALILEVPGEILGYSVGWWLLMLAVALTLISGADYFLKARSSIRPPQQVPVEGPGGREPGARLEVRERHRAL